MTGISMKLSQDSQTTIRLAKRDRATQQMADKILKRMEEGRYTQMIFMNMKKAEDTIFQKNGDVSLHKYKFKTLIEAYPRTRVPKFERNERQIMLEKLSS